MYLPPGFASGRVAEDWPPLFKRLLGRESLILPSFYEGGGGQEAESGAILGRRPGWTTLKECSLTATVHERSDD
jgi:hypothetical protein